jgi:hypothetical protein
MTPARETAPYRVEPLARGGVALSGPLDHETGRTFMFEDRNEAAWWQEWLNAAHAAARRACAEELDRYLSADRISISLEAVLRALVEKWRTA